MLSEQDLVDYIGECLDVQFEVLSNVSVPRRSRITLVNKGSKNITKGEWAIYSYHLCHVESDSVEVDIDHVVGGLFKHTPTPEFRSILPKGKLEINLVSDDPTVSRLSTFPNWYVTQPGLKPRVITSTVGETLSFVKALDTAEKWKKSKVDESNPFTPEERYCRHKVKDLEEIGTPILPTPLHSELDFSNQIDLSDGDWRIRIDTAKFANEAKILATYLTIDVSQSETNSNNDKVISFCEELIENTYSSKDAYKLVLDEQQPTVSISAQTTAGIFYAIQSLISLIENQGVEGKKKIPSGTVIDAPRFPYRGFHIDVSRNFIKADEIMKMIRVMSAYKMNKLHFHLTDDEGWRLEIKDLPELTDIGGKRDHDLARDGLAIEPTLGSGPHYKSCASGYYSAEEYQNILRCAAAHHVEVIPEIDMPGHSYAAIVAMTARFQRLKADGKVEEAKRYLPVEIGDNSTYTSVQKYENNTMNPCIEGTKNFVSKIISTLKELHEPVQPLKTFHIGGDEVPLGAWDASEICDKYVEDDEYNTTNDTSDQDDEEFDLDEMKSRRKTAAIQEYFMKYVESICQKEKLQMAVWNDGVRDPKKKQGSGIPKLVHAWRISRKNDVYNPNILANSGYQVVISSATHTYFDHPYEPDPEENGLTWCVRMMDTKTVFGMKPYNMYGCQDGAFTETNHEQLKNKSAIIGIQSHIWGELIRCNERLEYMLFPRLLAIAERGWHHAQWEDEDESSQKFNADWTNFANTLGYKELRRLEQMGIQYRVPPPGVKIENDMVYVTSAYPNLRYRFREQGSKEWSDADTPLPIKQFKKHKNYEFATFGRTRMSRIIAETF